MTIAASIMVRQAKLSPAETKDVTVEKDLQIPTPDGVVLLADHCSPHGLGDRPAVLVRSVYTDRTKGGFLGRLIAERGFHVVIVSGRGTCGSAGPSLHSSPNVATAWPFSSGSATNRGSSASWDSWGRATTSSPSGRSPPTWAANCRR